MELNALCGSAKGIPQETSDHDHRTGKVVAAYNRPKNSTLISDLDISRMPRPVLAGQLRHHRQPRRRADH